MMRKNKTKQNKKTKKKKKKNKQANIRTVSHGMKPHDEVFYLAYNSLKFFVDASITSTFYYTYITLV